MASTTSVIELETISHQAPPTKRDSWNAAPSSIRPSLNERRSLNEAVDGMLPSPTTFTEVKQTWKNPRVNIYRLGATFWGFIIMGANDSAVGALIPYLEQYYSLTYTIVSLLFLSPLGGYVASALLNNKVHLRFGQRGIAVICSSCHLLAYIVASQHPPFPVLVLVFILAGFGNGLEDAAWNAWVGNMANVNEVLGFLHGFYGLGATISPLIATAMITKANLPWYSYYYLMIGFAVIELASSVSAFWTATGDEFRRQNPRTTDSKDGRMKEAMFKMPAARVTWIITAFLFLYLGVEVALGGWVVTFMIKVRHGSPFASGMTATGFWLGLTIGRFILGFVTPRIGEKLAVLIYIPVVMGLELLFWLVPQFYVSAVAIGFQGFFIGPLFPATVVAATNILPRHLHVSAIGFAAAAGGGGAAVFPFAVGAIAQSKGVQVLQPIVLALLGGLFVLWCGLPRMSKKRD